MKRDFLGDSYDAVKRLWRDLLQHWAPLHADARFIPEDLRADFTLLTGIPMLTDNRPDVFSILNDPDTGIRLPGERNQNESQSHISISFIMRQLAESGASCVITFDQSDYRHSRMDREEQRQAKMRSLADSGFHSFYYVSHAPFLFAASNSQALREVRQILIAAGMPAKRLESSMRDIKRGQG
jgi:hypothetical protein